ncbi:MAG TPA: nicotinate-nucleotide--dimethylbenzimidazole phosphoribosyltransferase [Alphaproteobacteria bacterium]|nr:nicotinate-nucleotide--dimethylbenzimidazole phosphoribosyltransferase [Alphaproteobacteria bacterium]HNS45564.1 nicotinate-nucleotide--dimethylbenzimidazole phosphoribosyltransferase [Alphaproteobacteria bacterium]
MPHHQPQNSNNLAEITNLLDSIGIIEESPAKSASSALSWLAIAKGTLPSGLNYPRLSVFIGNHGFAEDFPSDPKNEQYVNKYVRDCGSGNLTLNRLAEHANCDIRLYELNPSGGAPLPNAIKTKSPATSETDLCLALAYGMVSVEPEIDLYATAALGAGSEAVAKAIIAAHTSPTIDAQDIQVSSLLALNHGAKGLECLKNIGGPEIAALCGTIIATRMGRIPVLLEGLAGYAALLILYHHNPYIVQHCAQTGLFDSSFIPDERFTVLPPPYDTAKETGTSLACLIASFRNEIALNGANNGTNEYRI